MTYTKILAATVACAAMALPISANAGSMGSMSGNMGSVACSADRPGTCPPGAVEEKVVPEYYSVPTKTKLSLIHI